MKNNLFILILSIFSTIAVAQSNQDIENYADNHVMPTNIEQSSGGTPCQGNRSDINQDFSTQDQILLGNLILQYLQSVPNPNFKTGDPEHQRWDIVAQHSAYGTSGHVPWHSNNETFFSWHRDYIQGLEQFLLNSGHPDFVPLPAWNPNNPIPVGLQGVVPGLPAIQNTNPAQNMYQVDNITCGQFSSMTQFAGFVRAGANNPTGQQFASHNAVHSVIGGSMGSVPTASGAVIFWLFHAHVDELYHCFQTECQECDPAFVFPKGKVKNCDYCFDFSENMNVQSMTVVLINELGIETSITLTPRGNCIPFSKLKSLGKFKVRITGTNSSSANTNCNQDVVTIPFTAPYQPPKTKFGNPCLELQMEPKGPIPNGGGGSEFRLTNDGTQRSFNIYNVNTLSAHTYVIGSGITLSQNAYLDIYVPHNMVQSGSNHIVIEVDGELFEYQYLIP